tara:strand:+ start:1801 stop:3939 length:2139 start_codon:yes stop_codon:yes gene_type:complete
MSTYSEIFGTRVESFAQDPTTNVTYTVTVASSDGQNRYFIDGVQQKQLRLYEGVTYVFNHPSAHPFRFATAPDAAGSTQYTTGVTVNSTTKVTIKVSIGAPTLYYYCSSHSGMGGRANTPTQQSVASQMWFNEAGNNFKSAVMTQGWSAGGPLITGGYTIAVFGSQTAAISVGATSPSAFTDTVQEYNGTGFSSQTSYPATISNSGRAGTATAGLIAGGWNGSRTDASNLWNGTAWSTTDTLPTAADNIGSCGTGTTSSVIMAMGRIPTSGNAGNNTTAVYNGSTFSSGPNIGTGRMLAQSSGGTGTAGIIYGGFIDPSPNAMTNTEEYDGSAWTAGGSLNRPSGLNCGWGTQTNAVAQVNSPGYKGAENYDGTSWTNLPDMTLADNSTNYQGSAGSTGDAGFITSRGPNLNQTEEFTKSTNVITAGAWASSGNLGTARRNLAGAGIQTSALAIGGEAPRTAKTELYNGATWSEVADLNTARNTLGASGTSDAAIAFGGEAPGPSTATETWNGSAWTTSPNGLNTGTRSNSGFGTTSSAINMGGFHPTPTRIANVEEWSGSSWATAPNALPAATANMSGFGIETAGVSCGGSTGSNTGATYEWGGSAWTTGGTMNYARNSATSGTGSQTAGLVSGGSPESGNAGGTEAYDGTTWSTRPSMGTSRSGGGGLGPSSASTAGLVSGGYDGSSDVNTTEEFTGETENLNIETLTQT